MHIVDRRLQEFRRNVIQVPAIRDLRVVSWRGPGHLASGSSSGPTAAPDGVLEPVTHITQRLHQRWVSLSARKKKHTVATAAIARELAGWCWSLATLPD